MKKYIPTTLRVLTGLLFFGSAIAGMMGKVPPPEPEAAKEFMGVLSGLWIGCAMAHQSVFLPLLKAKAQAV